MSIRSLVETGIETGVGTLNAIPQSLVSLVSRVAVAGVFWRSGQTKVDGFHVKESTFYLFREEYRVPLLPPDLAAYLATIGEHVLSIGLLVGLASRLSALGLLAMTAVIQLFVFPAGWPDHILWSVPSGHPRARPWRDLRGSPAVPPAVTRSRFRALAMMPETLPRPANPAGAFSCDIKAVCGRFPDWAGTMLVMLCPRRGAACRPQAPPPSGRQGPP
jgi:putative oxidoreductase